MKKFTKVNEEFEENLLRNKIENKTELSINITCDFCDLQDDYKCENNVANKEERWLAVETFIQKGWNELIIPKEKGIACPICVEKWEEGNWYVNENVDFDETKLKKFNEDFDFDEEDFDKEENSFSLKCSKRTIFHVDWSDFDNLVRKFYGQNSYEFAADIESPNDTSHEFSASKGLNDKWDKKSLDDFKKDGKFGWTAPILLNDLCDEGIIEEGDYLIRVSW